MHFKKHFFMYTVVLLTILFVAASYYRFMVAHDYLVSYEGYCDPYTDSCFLYCETDACTEPLYSSLVERRAYVVMELCGQNILDCQAADSCVPHETDCSISYCDPRNGDFCDSLTEQDRPNATYNKDAAATQSIGFGTEVSEEPSARGSSSNNTQP